MKVVVLTSSRADYSIYLPLLRKLKEDKFFDLNLIAFGSHLSKKHGYTFEHIENDGFQLLKKVVTIPLNDSPLDISNSIGKTIVEFSSIWQELKNDLDLIICLGDRFEMFAAVSASVPFNLPIAHIHGGETTEGAIDNIYRHSLTHMAKYHFASTLNHANRIIELKASTTHVYNVGSLGVESLNQTKLLSKEEFQLKYSIPITTPVLVTFHPETVNYERNEYYVKEVVRVLSVIEGQIIITMPNADTMGDCIRKHFIDFAVNRSNVFLVESLGIQGYYTCLNYCVFVLGNSSSGIIEAASFGKYVINIGHRQTGRDFGPNVLHCEINAESILEKVKLLKEFPKLNNENIYCGGNVSLKIVSILKNLKNIEVK